MTGNWTVKRITAKDGTTFPWWRVQDPSGRTVCVLRDRVQALTFADRQSRTQLHAEFAAIINLTWGTKLGGAQP